MRVHPSSLLAAAVLLAALGSGCRQKPAAPPAHAGGAMPVQVAAPEQRAVTDWGQFSGRVDAIESVEIRPRVTGYIEKVNFEAGQMVKKDDVLFVIDPRWNKATVDQTKAQVELAKANLENAERETDRTDKLAKGGALSASEIDQQRTRLSLARASLLAAQAAHDTAQLDLEMTQVRSPIDGKVSRALLTEGNYVSGVAGFTTLMTTVVRSDVVYIYVSVDEATYLRFAKLFREKKIKLTPEGKIPAEAQLAGDEGFPHRGYIESFDNRIDPATGSIVVRAVFENKERALVPGAFARVRVPASEEYQALLVDEKIIGTDQDQKFVYTVGADSTVEYRALKLGEHVGGKRVVLEGLKPDDRLIVSGLQMLRPGMPVQPLPPTPAAGEKTAQR